MAYPLMPKATAVWLVENTALTFAQISKFCGLHELEVQAIADGEVATGMQGLDPIAGGELTQEELDRCATDPSAQLVMAKSNIPIPKARSKGARYTPVSKRQDRPDAISWLLRNQPELTDAQISKLIGTTKPTINAIRERSHWNMPNIKPQNPVGLGLCLAPDLEKAVARARAKMPPKSTAEPTPESEATPPATESGTPVEEPAPEAIKMPKPGEITLLKAPPKEATAKPVPAFADEPPPKRLSGVPSTPEVLLAAEDVFAPRPVEPLEPTDEPAPEPPLEEDEGKKEADATPDSAPEDDAS